MGVIHVLLIQIFIILGLPEVNDDCMEYNDVLKCSVIYSNLPVNAIVRLPHPRSRDSQGQETFLAPSADKQTRSYDADIYGWIKQQNHLRTIL